MKATYECNFGGDLRIMYGRPDLSDPVTVWIFQDGWHLASCVVERCVGARIAAQFLTADTATVVAPVARLMQLNSHHVNLPAFL